MRHVVRLPRVVSLLPSATEMVCAVGGREMLVGRSHECDYPAGIESLPVLTRPRRALPETSRAIDRAIREILAEAIAVYEVDVDGLRACAPHLIVTQDLCDVCAVSLDDVRGALRELARCDVRLISLRPTRLADVWDDVRRVGAALGRTADGNRVADALAARCAAIGQRSGLATHRPSVLTIEWLDPVMIGGTWMPELVELAGGRALVTTAGQHAPTVRREELEALDPDVVLIKPCGFPIDRTARELDLLATNLPWKRWRAVARGAVFVADGNAFFNRPGPRLVESLEILAACVQPRMFAEFAARHASSVHRVNEDLALLPLPASC